MRNHFPSSEYGPGLPVCQGQVCCEFCKQTKVWSALKAVEEHFEWEIFQCLSVRTTMMTPSGEIEDKEIEHDPSPIHAAILSNDSEKLEYLLSRDGVDLDARCPNGKTPLHAAVGLGCLESVKRLVLAGCDINLPDGNEDTPLHVSIYHSEICHFLIRSGAQIDAVNDKGATVLHEAVTSKCHEVLCMLLYYNADANVADEVGRTPFMVAVDCCNVEAQRILLEYVDDFNRAYCPYGKFFVTTLCLALKHDSPLAVEVIERGADVNYGDEPDVCRTASAFNVCLLNPVEGTTFKTVWERLRYNHSKKTIDFIRLFKVSHVCTTLVPSFLQTVIDGDNFEPAVEFFVTQGNYTEFVIELAEVGFNPDQLTALTCRLLQCGFRPTTHDIYIIFAYYDHCELLRLLLYMDNDYGVEWPLHSIVPRMKFDIRFDLEGMIGEVDYISKHEGLDLLQYFSDPPLIGALIASNNDDEGMMGILSGLLKVPSLLQLARDAARRHICKAFNITTTCRFYTTIDHLDIPKVYKQILTFEKKIYAMERVEIDCPSD